MSVTRRVVDWGTDLSWDAVPPSLRAWLGVRVADTVGLIGAARGSRPAHAVLEVARTAPGTAPLLFERATVMPAYAALAHGTLAHVYDYDDTYPESVVHPSSVVVPAALATGSDADPECVVLAMLAGYEFLARAGAVGGRRFHARGFHATGVLGPPAAALVAGMAAGADRTTLSHAMGLAGSMSGGLLEFLSDGSWSKRMHSGWAAHSGVSALHLAAGGFTGPATVLEGEQGLFRAFIDAPAAQVEHEFADLGSRWACLSLKTKLYPFAHVIHPYLELLLAALTQHAVDAADIASITCHVAPWAVPIVAEPLDRKRAPATEYEARASLPFALGLAVVDGVISPVGVADDAQWRPDVLDAAAKVSYVADRSLDTDFPARLVIMTRTGEAIELASSVADLAAEGTPRVRKKFETNLAGMTSSAGRQRIWDAAVGLADTGPAHLAATCLEAATA